MRRTNILLFENNCAHSYARFGLKIISNLGPGHTITGCSVYSPRVNPLDRHSDFVVIKLGKFIGKFHTCTGWKNTGIYFFCFLGFKNGVSHAVMRVSVVEETDWQLGEAPIGIYAQKNRVEGYVLFSNSIIIGDTDNKGKLGLFASPA